MKVTRNSETLYTVETEPGTFPLDIDQIDQWDLAEAFEELLERITAGKRIGIVWDNDIWEIEMTTRVKLDGGDVRDFCPEACERLLEEIERLAPWNKEGCYPIEFTEDDSEPYNPDWDIDWWEHTQRGSKS